MDQKSFKVVIVGGSVAGLSLALMLERNGIDFVVLEAYGSIAPQVGASFGVLPNGLRILDQLGCYDSVLKMAEYPIDTLHFRDSQGQPFRTFDKLEDTSIRRFVTIQFYIPILKTREPTDSTFSHGYPIIFLDRRMLIQVLYDKIQDKSKVLTSHRVQSIETGTSSSTVTTTTGQTYTGNIVVGADGIHSKVRQEMWKAAEKIDPTWIDPAEKSGI